MFLGGVQSVVLLGFTVIFGRPRPHSAPELFPGTLGRGGLWEWCSGCHTYAHYSAMVPEWWTCSLAVNESLLAPEPELLEAAL
jgi:hypothetical protein